MKFPIAFLKRRGLLLGIVALVATGLRSATPKPPERSVEGLAKFLGGAIGGVVRPEEMIWEQSPGALVELLFGRRVLFLGAPHSGEARDLYRARVRVTLDGQPLSVGQLRNVTDTPVGDDAALEARGDRATFATLAYGHIQGLSVLDLSGIRRTDKPEKFFDRVLLAINSYQDTGSFAGLGRTNIVLDVPAQSAKLTLDPPTLNVDFGDSGRGLHYETEQRLLEAASGGAAYAARVVPEVHVPKPLVLWLVDTVRAEVGPEPGHLARKSGFWRERPPQARLFCGLLLEAGERTEGRYGRASSRQGAGWQRLRARRRFVAAAERAFDLERCEARRR